MLENLPFEDTLSIVLMGDGNCAETVWTFMGLSIPEQTKGKLTFVPKNSDGSPVKSRTEAGKSRFGRFCNIL